MSITVGMKAEKTNTLSGAVIVAFSGGCDSLAMLYLLSKSPKITKLKAVYVNHNLRSNNELFKEIELNKSNCKKLSIPLQIVEIPKGKIYEIAKERGNGIEEAARKVRYDSLERIREKENFDWIATAHNRNDQDETILMRLKKGSPFSSLVGIRKINGKIIRPVLDFHRKDLETILNTAGLTWSEDSTNSELDFTRNKIRNLVIPELKKILPNYSNILACIRQKAVIDSQKVEKIKNPSLTANYLELSHWQKIQLLFRLWNKKMDCELSQNNCNRIIKAIDEKNSMNIAVSGAIVMVLKDKILIEKQKDIDTEQKKYPININTQFTKINLWNNLILSYGTQVKMRDELDIYLDSKELVPPVIVRTANSGDYIKLKDGTKKVTKLLQDMKVPSPLRCCVPVLEDAEGIVGVFARCVGGKDRISIKFRTTLAPTSLTVYIIEKGI